MSIIVQLCINDNCHHRGLVIFDSSCSSNSILLSNMLMSKILTFSRLYLFPVAHRVYAKLLLSSLPGIFARPWRS